MEVVQLDDPLEAGLQVAILFEHPLILLAYGLLDSGDLAASRTVGFRNSGGAGCCRCVGPVLEDRQGPLQLPHGADDGHDLDGSAALAERLPEAQVRFAPRAERRRGVVSGLDVYEECALGVQRDRQLGGKPGSVCTSTDGTTTWQHAAGCVYHMVCPKVVSRVTRWVYGRNTQKRRDLEARPPACSHPENAACGLECNDDYILDAASA